jgi:hypothetical protein
LGVAWGRWSMKKNMRQMKTGFGGRGLRKISHLAPSKAVWVAFGGLMEMLLGSLITNSLISKYNPNDRVNKTH